MISIKSVSKALSVDLNRVLYVKTCGDAHPAPTDSQCAYLLQKPSGKGCWKWCRLIKKMCNRTEIGRQISWFTVCCSLSAMSYFCKGAPGWTKAQYSHQAAHTRSDLRDAQLALLIYFNLAACKNDCLSAQSSVCVVATFCESIELLCCYLLDEKCIAGGVKSLKTYSSK